MLTSGTQKGRDNEIGRNPALSSTESWGNTGPTRAINSHAKRRQRDLIDQAAEGLGKTRTNFLLGAARPGIEDTLLNHRVFTLVPEALQKFQTLLDSPPDKNPKLRKLTATSAP